MTKNSELATATGTSYKHSTCYIVYGPLSDSGRKQWEASGEVSNK